MSLWTAQPYYQHTAVGSRAPTPGRDLRRAFVLLTRKRERSESAKGTGKGKTTEITHWRGYPRTRRGHRENRGRIGLNCSVTLTILILGAFLCSLCLCG